MAMRAAGRVLITALVACSVFCLSDFAPAQQSDQVIAGRVLGAQWKQLSRRAGMIFAGTVLAAAPQTVATQTVPTQAAPNDRAVPAAPAVQLSFRVDHAIAGVKRGQILTIHEWAGAWSMHRPMRTGQHILIFFYPPSRLGFTSPVGGSLGQVALDASGKNVAKDVQQSSAPSSENVSLVQLERAIRSARSEEE